MRFKVGDKSQGVVIISIGDDQYHLLCECENPFSRSLKMDNIPLSCRRCADDKRRSFTSKNDTGLVFRELNDKEQDMIKEFEKTLSVAAALDPAKRGYV